MNEERLKEILKREVYRWHNEDTYTVADIAAAIVREFPQITSACVVCADEHEWVDTAYFNEKQNDWKTRQQCNNCGQPRPQEGE